MKVSFCIWAGQPPQNLPVWFKHGEVAEFNLEMIKELFDLKINTLIQHSKHDHDMIILYVDTQRFQQR